MQSSFLVLPSQEDSKSAEEVPLNSKELSKTKTDRFGALCAWFGFRREAREAPALKGPDRGPELAGAGTVGSMWKWLW